MKGRILITGATGNLGSEVARLGAERGLPLRLALRRPGEQALPDGVQSSVFDFTRPETHAAALEGVETLLLVRPPALARLQHFEPLLDASASAGLRRVVFLSVAGAERLPFLPHAKIEKAIVRRGLVHSFLRAGFFMQNLADAERREIVQQGELFAPVGHARVAFVDTRDLAELALRELEDASAESRSWTLTGGEAVSYGELAGMLSQQLDRPIRYEAPSLRRFWREKRRQGVELPYRIAQSLIYMNLRFGGAGRIHPELARELGRPPRSMRDYIRDNAELFRS